MQVEGPGALVRQAHSCVTRTDALVRHSHPPSYTTKMKEGVPQRRIDAGRDGRTVRRPVLYDGLDGLFLKAEL